MFDLPLSLPPSSSLPGEKTYRGMPLTSGIFHDFPPAARSIKYLIIKRSKRYRLSKRIPPIGWGRNRFSPSKRRSFVRPRPCLILPLDNPISLSLSLFHFSSSHVFRDMCLDCEKCRVCSCHVVSRLLPWGRINVSSNFLLFNSERRFLFLLLCKDESGRLVYCSSTSIVGQVIYCII